MKRSLRALAAATLALVLSLALPILPAHALSLAEAKQASYVGERPDGYLGIVTPSPPAEVRRLVEEINARRSAEYTRIANSRGTTPAAVAAIAGAEAIARAEPGHYFMTAGGQWVRK